MTQPPGNAIAVVGLACRFPGAPDPRAYWELLRAGGDAVTDIPHDRWDTQGMPDPPTPGRVNAGRGGFLDQVDRFDAEFFSISPREAAAMDPQQRLMLELSWEALESAGVLPEHLRDTRTGVFAGVMWEDYAKLSQRHGPDTLTSHSTAALHRSVIANRVSYFLGLRGPSLTVDTGQSSSLTAVHLAAESLRSGESTIALAGGVNLLLAPETHTVVANLGAMSPDGRCYTFDERANGFVRGEGGGVVVLKTLGRALADGDPIHAVIRGSALNNDGATPGLTVPGEAAQQDVLRQAYRQAGIRPRDAQYLELHGTGTAVGDPIEAAAAGAVLGENRPANTPLLVGSAKTNIGHLEGAAGIAGLLKVILSITHRRIPPSLNYRSPNPRIPLDDLALRVQTELTPWPRDDKPLAAGVSSFGMGGTNCHIVLTEAPARTPSAMAVTKPTADAELVPWPISARSPAALRAMAERLHTFVLNETELDPYDVGHSLATTRTAFPRRAVVLGTNRDELLDGLRAISDGTNAPNAVTGAGAATAGKTAFVFTGQGSQWPGMGRQLHAESPVFAQAMDDVLGHFEAGLREVMFAHKGSAEAHLLHRTAYTQAALFAYDVAMYRLVESLGLTPDYLVGHSIGELSAAHLAGVLTLPDACRLVAARGRLMQALPDGGAMTAVRASADDVRPYLSEQVALAAVNSPVSVVISGPEQPVRDAADRLRAAGHDTSALRVSHAFHSPLMRAMVEEFREVARSVSYSAPTIPIMSNLTGDIAAADHISTADYWADHVEHTVLFHDAITRLTERGVTRYLEIGPRPALSPAIGETIAGEGGDHAEGGGSADGAGSAAVAGRAGLVATTSRSDDSGLRRVLVALATLHNDGAQMDWTAWFGGRGKPAELPTYPFQRERHWLDIPASAPAPRPEAGDAKFWEYVEQHDLEGLADTLELNGDDGGEEAMLGDLLSRLRSWRRRERARFTMDGQRYRPRWSRLVEANAPQIAPGTWLVVAPAGPHPEGLVHACLAAVENAVRVEGVQAAVEHLRSGAAAGIAGVLSLLALEEGTARWDEAHPGEDAARGEGAEDDLDGGVAGAVMLRDAVASADTQAALWLVTAGAVEVPGVDREVSRPLQAQLWGAQLTNDTIPGIVDLPENTDERTATTLAAALRGSLAEGRGRIAVRATGAFGCRFERMPRADTPEQVWQTAGTVLVTGADQVPGVPELVHWLARRGAERIILAADGSAARLEDIAGEDIASTDAEVLVADCDPADREALGTLLAAVPDARPLSAVLHAVDASADRSDQVRAITNLNELTADAAAFVLLSPVADGSSDDLYGGAVGAVSAFAAAVTRQRRATGRHALSVTWRPWTTDPVTGGRRPEVRTPMDPGLTVTALQDGLDRDDDVVVVADLDRNLDGDLDRDRVRAAGAAAAAVPEEIAGANEESLRGVEPLVRAQAAAVLGHSQTENVDMGLTFKELGFDSLMSVEFRDRVAAASGERLPATLVFDYPTPEAVANFLRRQLGGEREPVRVERPA
ncbi:beta-ketoacyl synthase N-terminal-like domain-containing protein, partial [Streptomyces sp. NPDC058103]